MQKDRGKILIFGGTTEGRTAAERLLSEGIPCTVSVATPYGAEVMSAHPLLTIHTGRLDCGGMVQLMRDQGFVCVIDATHPHALLVSREIEAACRDTGLPYLRLLRKDLQADSVDFGMAAEAFDGKASDQAQGAGNVSGKAGGSVCTYVRDIDEAAAFLASVSGRILVTTGSKELVRFSKALGDPSRITARVLPAAASLQACGEAGLMGKQIFAMQGPFDTQMNCALIRHAGASWLLTKETGAAGGFPEKMEAVRQCGIRAVVVCAPSAGGGESCPQNSAFGETAVTKQDSITPVITSVNENVIPVKEQYLDLEQTIAAALKYAAGSQHTAGRQIQQPAALQQSAAGSQRLQRMLSLIGIGVGAPEAMTQEARQALSEAEAVFGARSILDNLKKTAADISGKTLVPVYESSAILDYLREHPQIINAAVAYSGDSGFYSGASSMLTRLKKNQEKEMHGKEMQPFKASDQRDQADFVIRVICGISSVSWFAARAGIPWQDWKILSSHGRFCNVTGQVRRNRKCFLLLSGAEDLRKTGSLLQEAQKRGVLGHLRLIYGYDLSRPEEEIRECSAQELTEVTKEGLYVLYIEHAAAEKTPVVPGLSDSAFTRGKAPMTSSEIRALSLCRLGLTSQAVVWDVGAGTGSVSIEAALACPEGTVFSIEYKPDALGLLAENRAAFCLQNMEIIEGRAPQALEDLPAPTHVFIGGSGGEIGQILEIIFAKNPEARVVVNCITSETLAALHQALERIPVRNLQCAQVSVNREEMLGRYHYLRAGNPVFIISFEGHAE